MTEKTLETLIAAIQPLDKVAMQAARVRQDSLTKPRGSLGRLESLSIQIAGITGQALPRIKHKVVILMAGDHGVVSEGVSAYPSEVTAQMVANFLRGGAAINVLARHCGARVIVADLGVSALLAPHPSLIVKKIARGTRNIAHGAAMSRQQAIQAILAGISVAEAQMQNGADLIATGDMGIGNTTPSAAIASALSWLPAANFVGRGAGIDDSTLERKVSVVEQTLQINRPDPRDGIDVLSKVGGFEIGGLTGVILAAAAYRCPLVVDGFISCAAAMIAVSLAPQVRPFLIASHRSPERGHDLMLQWLEIEPLLDLHMRLGEGSGAVLGMSIVEAACKTLVEMATFSEAGVSDKIKI